MQVRAIQPAFHDGRRVRVGDILDVPDTLVASWFVRADGPAAPESPSEPPRAARRARPVALSQMAREKTAGPLDKTVDALV